MSVEDLITLDDGKKYALLYGTTYNNEKYFMAALVENGEPTTTYELLKEIDEPDGISVENVDDKELKNTVVELMEKSYDEADIN